MLYFHAQKKQDDLWHIYCGGRLVKTINGNTDHRQVLLKLNKHVRDRRSLCLENQSVSLMSSVAEIEAAVNID